MTMDRLRDYQREMLDRLDEAWGSHRSVMVQMPTGTGKTVLLAEVIRKELRGVALRAGMKNGGVIVVAHRIELIDQISRTLDDFGIEHGLIVSGKPEDATKSVQVASIQTLTRNSPTGPTPDPSPGGGGRPALVVIDEAHHALAKTYRVLWEWWPEARFLGLTATPCRLNNAPFTDLFQTLLQSYSIQEFIDKGWLSDFEYVSASPDSEALKQVRMLRKRGPDGDYQTKELVTVMDVPESIAHLYKTYKQFANG
ncbi:MAG: DEAD/DEAH box helicase family protein, partial [Prevotella sp.]|nr:DEAD/DEAH box helicase family protein [Prevotella sp.]